MRNSALVVCIGNPLVADDGVGWAVFQELQKRKLPSGARLEFLAVSGMRVMDELDGENMLIVVDAQCTGAKTGTVSVRDLAHLDAVQGRPVTSHDIGIREALEICKKLYPERMPKKTFLVGIEGQNFSELGAPLTRQVADAVDHASQTVVTLLGQQEA